MARENLELFIRVTDANGAATFKRLGDAGKKATDEIEKGSKSGAKSLKDLDRAAQDSTRSAERMKSAFTAVGVGLGGLVTGLAAAGTASREQTRQVDGIRRAYGEAADQMLEFASAVQESTNFSDDAARQSLISIQGLANQYGITQAQIEGLITRSADLAAINGIGLEDAVTRTSAALRGEGEAAEALGLNLSDTAVAAAAAAAGLTGWNTTMTEGEKAAFRYTILMEQSAFATGAAAEAADTASGSMIEFRDDLQNATAELGEFIGPAAEVASVLGSFALAAPLAGGAFGKMAAGAATAAGATGLGGLAAGIAGVGLAAGAAIVPLAAFTAVMIKGAEERSDDFTADFEEQTARLNALGIAADENVKRVYDFVRTFNATGATVDGQVQHLNDSFDELLHLGGPYLETLLYLTEGMELNGSTAADVANLIEDLYQTQREGEAAAYAMGQAELWAGQQTEGYAAALASTLSVEEKILSVRQQRAREEARLGGPNRQGLIDPNDEGMGLPDYNAEVARSTLLQGQMAEVQGRVADGFGAIKEAAAAAAEGFAVAASEVVAFIGQADNILPVLLEAGKGLTGEQGLIRGVLDLTNARAALDSTFDILIGGSNAIGQSSQQVADWAQGLLDVGGAGADLNALNSILVANAAIQEDVTAIQAAQAGYIADATDNYAQYVDQLANGTAEQQRYALALMDSNSQQQLADLYAAATSASLGQLGENGVDYVNQMAASLAVTNPLLYQMLVDTGAIKETSDGIEFDFDSADAVSMVSVLGDLNATLVDLTELIAEVNGLTISPQIDPKVGAALAAFTKPTGQFGAGDGTGGQGGTAGVESGLARNAPASDGTNITQTITFVANAEPYFAVSRDVEANAELLAGIQPQLLLTADGSQAIQVFRDTEGAIIAVSNGEYIVKVMGDPTDASNDIALVNKILNDINGTEGTVYVLGDESSATGAVGNAAAARDGIDGSGATIYVYGDGSSARNTINSLTGVQGYATVIVNAVRGTSAGFTDIGLATGGTLYPGMGEYAPSIPSYATGGTHAMVGEHGPEMVWLPNGSQVTNAVATESRRRDRGGGSGITIIGPVTFRVENENVGAAIRSQLLAGGGW